MEHFRFCHRRFVIARCQLFNCFRFVGFEIVSIGKFQNILEIELHFINPYACFEVESFQTGEIVANAQFTDIDHGQDSW